MATEGQRLYEDALKWMEQRQIVLPDEYYGKMSDVQKLRAFSVAQITTLDELAAIHESLMTAIDTGQTMAQWKTGILNNPDTLEAAGLSKARLDNIFRTNVQHAYMMGITSQQETPKALKRRPFFQYDAINDSRTRPEHRAMDNFIARHDDPVWQRWTPLCGYRCRCVRTAISEAEAVARGWKGQTPPVPAEPDPGFAVHPLANDGKGAITSAIEARAAKPGGFWNNPVIQSALIAIIISLL
jgi:SPP1 gp7 family putative phage head morphogenesis protein